MSFSSPFSPTNLTPQDSFCILFLFFFFSFLFLATSLSGCLSSLLSILCFQRPHPLILCSRPSLKNDNYEFLPVPCVLLLVWCVFFLSRPQCCSHFFSRIGVTIVGQKHPIHTQFTKCLHFFSAWFNQTNTQTQIMSLWRQRNIQAFLFLSTWCINSLSQRG